MTNQTDIDINIPLQKLDLQTQLSSLPVSPLSVVSNLVTGLKSEPLGQGSVLLLGFGKHLFDLQRFVGSHFLVFFVVVFNSKSERNLGIIFNFITT